MRKERKMDRFLTKCVHNGIHRSRERAINTPIYQSSTFLLKEEDYKKLIQGKGREINIYSRYGNPTRRSVEEKIASLENTDDALSFSSGMGAIASTLITFLKPGDKILTTIDIYGGTWTFIADFLPRFGIKAEYVNPVKTDKIIKEMKGKKVLFFESLSNPLLKLIDIDKISKNKKKGQLLIIDNTFLTPFNFNPVEYGADLVIHSASKYLNGHSDLIGGLVCGNKNLIDRIWSTMILLGSSMEPIPAYLLERGMKTLGVRMERHNRNAEKVALFLEDHKEVKKVIHPSLESYTQKELKEKYLKVGCGGMITFVVRGGDRRGLKFMHCLKVVKEASSLGGVESLISMPFNTSHYIVKKEKRIAMGILPGTLRLSVGIEDPEDIIEDINQALIKTA